MTFTTDKLRSLVRKWQTLIEAVLEVKTSDGYTMRLFCIGFTKRAQGQIRKTSYAQSSQIKEIRKKMFEIMHQEASTCDLKELVAKLIPDSIGEKIEKASPRENCLSIDLSHHLLCSDLPLAERAHMEGKDREVSKVRFDEAHGCPWGIR